MPSKKKNLAKKKVERVSPRNKKKIAETSMISQKKFLNEECKKKGKVICELGIIVERTIDESAFDKYRLIDLLTEKGLIKSALFTKSYNLSLVQEFYSNISQEVRIPTAKGFQKVYVRWQWIDFSPEGINEFLEY